MNKKVVKELAIRLAASLARGDTLNDLRQKAEKQTILGRNVILRHLDNIEEHLKICAVTIRELVDCLPPEDK